MRIDATLRRSADLHPAKVFLATSGGDLTCSAADRGADRLAATLTSLSVSPGDRVLICAGNSQEAVIGLYGAMRAGAAFVPLHPSTKAKRLAQILTDCRPAVAILSDAVRPAFAEVLDAGIMPRPRIIVTGSTPPPWADLTIAEACANPAPPSLTPGSDATLAALIYTSGSTGAPKGVMLTHRNLEAAALAVMAYLENTTDDVILSNLPIAFSYGLHQVLTTAIAGATLLLEAPHILPKAMLNKVASHRVTGLPLVPTSIAALLQLRDPGAGGYPELRYITSASAPLPPAHARQLQAAFPTTKIFSMHGMTECKRCCYLPPEQLFHRPTSVGIPIPGAEAYVLGEDGEIAPPGVIGELVVTGPHVMQGYWNNPIATDRSLRPGPRPGTVRLHTGDLFRTDEEGFLYFVARQDDIIKTRGAKVSPREVEDAICEIPGVREVSVIGVPDPMLGTAVKAVVVPTPGSTLTSRDVIRHCAACLEDFMVPREVEFRDELPKTDTGKTSRRLVALTAGAA